VNFRQPIESEALSKVLQGGVIRPDGPDYESARRIHNGMIDRRPALIARCASTSDVTECVRFARRRAIPVSVLGGGHGVPGSAVCDEGLMIDLSGLRQITVDPERRTALAGGGAVWGDFDRETQKSGLATTGGIERTTGIGGLTLAGGYGFLMRKYGLTCDNLRAAEVVTADGEVVIASEGSNADLFWGIRGGGGNFGIVTSFEYSLHSLGPVYGGMVAWPIRQARELIRRYDDFVPNAPDELGSLLVLGTLPDGTKAAILLLCYCGEEAEAMRCLAPLLGCGSPLMRQLAQVSYQQVQSIVEDFNPRGMRNYWKSGFLNEITEEAADVLVERFMTVPGHYTHVVLYTLGGAVARVPCEATPVENRDARHCLLTVGMWDNSIDDEINIGFVRELSRRMDRFASGGFYINFEYETPTDHVRAAFGPGKFARLQKLKDKYDPTNFFRLNQNIPPTGNA
jgi:hypothetical protein